MIVKILSSSSTFNGVSYNTNKTEKDRGELMKVENFGYLQFASGILPQEYKNYLKAVSSINTRVKNKQFHAILSCKGQDFDKHDLTRIGEAWLKEMGYRNNPYMIVFHKDTSNNHIHLVSTRIKSDGTKVNDSFEKKRGSKVLTRILQGDIHKDYKTDLNKISAFSLSTVPQYKMLWENMGYSVAEKDDNITLRKYDELLGSISVKEVEDRIKSSIIDGKRALQIKALINKYKQYYSVEWLPVYRPTTNKSIESVEGFTNDLAAFLKEKFGLQLVFHNSGEKEPYGYTIIDHSKGNVFKGSEVLPLKELIRKVPLAPKPMEIVKIRVASESDQAVFHTINKTISTEIVSKEELQRQLYITTALLKAALHEAPTFSAGLRETKIMLFGRGEDIYVFNSADSFFCNSSNLGLNKYDWEKFKAATNQDKIAFENENERYANESFSEEGRAERQSFSQMANVLNEFNLDIANDIDDEQINGRNRRRVKKARTNTR